VTAQEREVIFSTHPCHCPRCHQERPRFVLTHAGAICVECYKETNPVIPITRGASAT
jgi:hypothetical protein